MAIASMGMIVGALMTRPGGYSFSEVPSVMLRVFARLAT
jgi:hypothetical protein